MAIFFSETSQKLPMAEGSAPRFPSTPEADTIELPSLLVRARVRCLLKFIGVVMTCIVALSSDY